MRATLLTALVVLTAGSWRVSHLLRDSVIAVPMLEPVKTAQIYLFDNGYTEERSFITRSDAIVDHGAIQPELRFQAGDRFRLDFLGTGSVQFGGVLRTERLGLFSKTIRTYAFDPRRQALHDLTAGPDGRLQFSASADPYIDVALSQLSLVKERKLYSAVLPVFIVFLLALPFLVYSWYATIRRHYLLVMAAAAFCCFLAMVGVCLPLHHGPDETLHIASGEWYTQHLFPPSMVDPAVYYDSYFGVDYIIGNPDLTYLLTFKTASLLDAVFPLTLHERARMAQVFILAAVFLLLLRFVSARAAAGLLIAVAVVPQASYLFTYVNGDALSFCFAVAALAVVAFPARPGKWAVALAFFVMANLKLQYALVIPVAALLMYRASRFQHAAFAAGGFVAGLYHYAFQVFDQLTTHLTLKANQIAHAGPAMRERVEHGFWDPSPIHRPDFYLSSAKSLYAIFGQMNFAFHTGIYVIGIILAWYLLRRNGWRVNVALLGVLGLNIAASLWFSCTYAYQPQGRYLLPAVAIAMAMFIQNGRFRAVLPFTLVTLFCLMRFVQAA